jgi:hypothetical protein
MVAYSVAEIDPTIFFQQKCAAFSTPPFIPPIHQFWLYPSVTTPGDMTASVDLARLIAPWGQPEVGTHGTRASKAAGRFHRCDVSQGGERPNAGYGHQQTTDRLRSDLLPHCLIEHGDLLAQLPPSGQ